MKPFTAGIFLLLPVLSQAQTGDDIFADYSANPDTHPNLSNNSFAGYRAGETPIPDVPVVATLTDFGGNGDGVADNTAAFAEAIAAAWRAGGGAVFIPAGTYRVEEMIHLNRSGVVLRGEDRATTSIVFPNSLEDVIGADGVGTSRWSWRGGLITVMPEAAMKKNPFGRIEAFMNGDYEDWTAWWSGEDNFNGPELAQVTNTPLRGATEVDVDNASGLRVGDYYLMSWESDALNGDYSLWKHIAGHPTMEDFNWAGAFDLNKRTQFQWPVRIASISGNTVRLAQPTRIDIPSEWNVAFEPVGPVINEAGVESLTLDLQNAPLTTPHNQYNGWNGVFFSKTINCWARDITVRNSQNGFLTRSNKHLTISDVRFEGTVELHHATTHVRAHDSLVESFTLDQEVHHGISVEDLATGMVYRDGNMTFGTFDSHRFMPFDVLRTNITLTNETGGPGGASDFGPFVGKNVVHWNIDITGPSDRGAWVNHPETHSMGALVGVRGAPEDYTTPLFGMEPGPKGTIIADAGSTPTITDLYQAQFDLRADNQPWIELAQPNDNFAPPGDIDFVASVNPGNGRTVSSVELLLDGASFAQDTTAPFTATWANAPAGGVVITLKMTDDLGTETFSVPKTFTVGNRIRVQSDDPRVTRSGSWSSESASTSDGGSLRGNSVNGSAWMQINFVGTRLQVYGAERNGGSEMEVYLDDLAIAATRYGYNTVNSPGQLIYDSGELPDGLHTARFIAFDDVDIDYFEITETAALPVNTPPVPAFTSAAFVGEAPFAFSADASGSTDAEGPIATYRWNDGEGGVVDGPTLNKTFTNPGMYVVRLEVTDSAGQPTVTDFEVRVTPSISGIGLKQQVVRLLGNITDGTQNFTSGLVQTTVDLDGDGSIDDGRSEYPLGTIPVVDGGNYFGHPLYGRVVIECLDDSPPSFSDREVEDSHWNDQLNIRSAEDGFWGLLYVDKTDFVNGGSERAVTLNSVSELRLDRVSSTENLGDLRFIVRQGGTFYLSKAKYEGGGSFTLDFDRNDDDKEWAVWDPTAGKSPADSTLEFQTHDFTDIDGFGFAWGKPLESSTSRNWLKVADFSVTAQAAGPEYLPEAVISPVATEGLAPFTVNFDGTGSTPGLGNTLIDYRWNFGDGSNATGTTASHTYVGGGTYTATLTVETPEGLTDTTDLVLQITDPNINNDEILLIDWNGDYVDGSEDFRGGSGETTTGLDLDGDTMNDDSQREFPFQLDVPMTPESSDYSGVSIYGGMRGEQLDGGPGNFSNDGLLENASGDKIGTRFQAGAPSKFSGVLLWVKNDFLNFGSGSNNPVSFNDKSSLRIGRVSRFDNFDARWVVRDNDQLWVSQNIIDPSGGEAELTFATTESDGVWALWSNPETLHFDATAASFVEKNFSDITAIGFCWDTPTFDSLRYWIEFGEFQVVAALGDLSPSDPILAWRTTHFGADVNNPALEASVWGDAADPNNNGTNNLMEFLLGTDPNSTAPLPISVIRDAETLILRYSRRINRGSRHLTPEWSTNLDNPWSSTGITETIIGNDGEIETVDASLPATDRNKAFIRLRESSAP